MTAIALGQKRGLLDRLDLVLLQVAKRGRERLDAASRFHGSYTEEDAARDLADGRRTWRFGVMLAVQAARRPEGL
ncbi:MAG TPA: hypothetical protein VI409_04555 [Gaiellaceae bacterium]|nr:hypothetical protein [Gaiellaceae bacterium]